jgi:hypothetical protein
MNGSNFTEKTPQMLKMSTLFFSQRQWAAPREVFFGSAVEQSGLRRRSRSPHPSIQQLPPITPQM